MLSINKTVHNIPGCRRKQELVSSLYIYDHYEGFYYMVDIVNLSL